jgi:CRISPR type II-A-associated protein Csn2
MKLVHPNIETMIEFEDGVIHTLVIEEPSALFALANDFYAQVGGGEGRFVLSKNDAVIKISDTSEMLVDYFCIQLNDKKMQSLLLKKLVSLTHDSEVYSDLILVNQVVQQLMFNAAQHIDVDIDYDESIDPMALFKAMNIKFSESGSALVETLTAYINLLIELKKLRILCLVNIKSFLDPADLQKLYMHCAYAKVNLLLFENVHRTPIDPNEKVVIIDKDLCEILVNY